MGLGTVGQKAESSSPRGAQLPRRSGSREAGRGGRNRRVKEPPPLRGADLR